VNLRFLLEQIELRSVEKRLANDRNPRKHNDNQVGQIARSIAFGMMSVMLAGSAGNIIAGNARAAAACTLGLALVPLIVVDHSSDYEKRAYAITDNKLALKATWDEEILKVELEGSGGPSWT